MSFDQRLPTFDKPALEPPDIEFTGIHAKQIAGRLRLQPPAQRATAQPRDGGLERILCARVDPELVEQAVGGHGVIRMEEQHGQDGALARSPQRDRLTVLSDLERPEKQEVHLHLPSAPILVTSGTLLPPWMSGGGFLGAA